MMSGIFTKNTDTNSGVNFAVSSKLILETIPFKINKMKHLLFFLILLFMNSLRY